MKNERYHRQELLPGFGPAAQEKLAAAKVLVVGAGGLGVPALQYLAGAGVGVIGIADGDVVSLSNLHRQVLYTTAEVGLPKAALAARKLTALNPEIRAIAHPAYLSPANALALIREYDVVLDATDNFAARYLINDACVLLQKPLVYGAAHRYEGQLSVFNFRGGPTYRCLYPTPPGATQIPDCNTGGVLGMVPGIIGCHQALEAVKIVAGIGQVASGVLRVYDFLAGSPYEIMLRADPANRHIAALQADYGLTGEHSGSFISVQELAQWYGEGRAFRLLDVREPEAYALGGLPGAESLPIATLESRLPAMDAQMPLVLYCQRGTRSARALAFLHQQQPGLSLYDLAGGYDAWLAQHDAL